MTEQKAIELLKSNEKYAIPKDMMLEAENMAIKALEKQIEKKPKITIYNGYCSNCHYSWGHDRLATEERYGYKYFQYCPICGQRIDWEEIQNDSR